jgi:hypothetical protein
MRDNLTAAEASNGYDHLLIIINNKTRQLCKSALSYLRLRRTQISPLVANHDVLLLQLG